MQAKMRGKVAQSFAHNNRANVYSRRSSADAQAHSHCAENAVAFFKVTGRIQMARTRKIDVDDFLNRGRPRSP